MRSSQEMAPDAEQIQHDTVNRREPLELSGGRETPHPALTLSGRLMGDLRAIVRVLIVQWRTDGITRAPGGRFAAQRVSDFPRHRDLV